MNKIAHKIFVFLFSAAAAAALVSCSSGGNGDTGTNATGRTGTVGILLTDKPADPSLFDAINASIETAVLIGDDDDQVVLYSGPTKTVDLLRLKNESIPFTFKDNVPVGEYCKIRLILSDLELVLADDTPADPTDNETYHPKLPGNGKLDLVARDCFYVGPGETVTLQLDIDGTNSIHVVAHKKGFNFRPVIFVDVISQGFDAKLVRVEGEITRIDTIENAFLLCNAIPTEHSRSLGCVTIHLGKDAAYFDSVEFDGEPRPLSELLANDMLGKRVTVVGWPRYTVPKYDDDEEAHVDDDDHEDDDSDEKDDDYEHHPLMAVDALAVEYGVFLQVEGNIATDADTKGFDMTVSSGGPVITSDTLAVKYQPGDAGFNGTRIVSKSGVLLEPTQVVAPLPVQVDGTLELISGSDPILKAALVILDKALVDSEQLTGTVLTVGADSFTLAPDEAIVCGVATSEVFVKMTAGVEFLTVTITESGSEIVPGGVLKAGQTVGMNGRCDASGYITDNVVIVDDQRP